MSSKLNEVISQALKKLNTSEEKDLCRYLPGEKGGYIHHFSYKKMKHCLPEKLIALLQQYVTNPSNPQPLEPRKRERKKRGALSGLNLSEMQLKRLVLLAESSGDEDLAELLKPKLSLSDCQKALIDMVRNQTVDVSLWKDYVQAINYQQQAESVSVEAKMV